MREMGQLQSQEWANCFWTCKKMWREVTEGVWRKCTENSSQPFIFDSEIQDLWRFRVFWRSILRRLGPGHCWHSWWTLFQKGQGADRKWRGFLLFASFWCVIEMPRSCFTQSKAHNHFLICVCPAQSPKIQEQLSPADAMKALASCSPNGSPSALASCRGTVAIDISVERTHCLLRPEVLCWATWHGPMPLRQISWAGTVKGCDLSPGCLVWWSWAAWTWRETRKDR